MTGTGEDQVRMVRVPIGCPSLKTHVIISLYVVPEAPAFLCSYWLVPLQQVFVALGLQQRALLDNVHLHNLFFSLYLFK